MSSAVLKTPEFQLMSEENFTTDSFGEKKLKKKLRIFFEEMTNLLKSSLLQLYKNTADL